MEYILLILILIFAALARFLFKPPSSKPPKITSLPEHYQYESIGSLVTKSELKFYRALTVTVKGRHIIFSKVRMADVMNPKKGIYDKSTWHKAFNKIAKKHYDFVLCDPTTLEVQILIELDDSSHNRPERMRRDSFVNTASASARIPLIRVPVSNSYDYFELEETLYGVSGVPTDTFATR